MKANQATGISLIQNFVNVTLRDQLEQNVTMEVENVIAKKMLLEINVPNVLLNIMDSLLVKIVCVTLRDQLTILVTKMENAPAMTISPEKNATSVQRDMSNFLGATSVLPNTSIIQIVKLVTAIPMVQWIRHVMLRENVSVKKILLETNVIKRNLDSMTFPNQKNVYVIPKDRKVLHVRMIVVNVPANLMWLETNVTNVRLDFSDFHLVKPVYVMKKDQLISHATKMENVHVNLT